MATYPPFQLNKPRFDQVPVCGKHFTDGKPTKEHPYPVLHLGYQPPGTFFGRYKHFLDIIDPRTLFTTKQQLEDSIKLLDDYKNGTVPEGTTDEQLWVAQKRKQAIIHPDTGQKILMPFRMSGYIPFGTPIVVGLLLPNQTLTTTQFWQWLIRVNACVNFSNRNATKETSTKRFLMGYAGAVTSACSITVGLNLLIRKASGFSPSTRMLIQRFVPFPAVAMANVCNVTLMRFNELWERLEVMDRNGNTVGTSLIAAKMALRETAMTRIVLPAPILLIPSIIMTTIENKTTLLKRFPRFNLPLQAIVCTAAFAFALPLAISLFPQMSEVPVAKLEPEIQQATNSDIVVYNKGL